MRLRVCAVVLWVSVCSTAYAAHSVPVSNPVYVRYIVAPAYRTARAMECRSLAGQSVPVDGSSEGTTERSEWSGMKLLTRQLDCRYLAAFYAELQYAVRHHVLGVGAWHSCLRVAPAQKLKTAVGLAVYVQCLRMVRGTRACRAVRQDPEPFERTGLAAACAKLIRTNDWSQSGEPEWHGTPRSLFAAGSSAPRPAHRTHPVLHLPARVTLQGTIRTGSFLNCCLFGMGYVMPFSYLHLHRPQPVSDWWLGKTDIQDIQLAGTAGSAHAGQPVTVSCRQLFSGQTGHFGESVYCSGATITRAVTSSGRHSERCGEGPSSACRAQNRRGGRNAKRRSGPH